VRAIECQIRGDDMSDEQQIAALREEIRKAGRRIRRVRWLLALVPAPILAAWAFWLFLYVAEWRNPDPNPWGWRLQPMHLLGSAVMGGATGAAVLFASLPVAFAMAAIYRSWCRRHAHASLEALRPDDRLAVLLPMRNAAEGDARRVVEALVRDFRLSLEITPARASDAHGNEASPAENTR
jgi:hypothetical protein